MKCHRKQAGLAGWLSWDSLLPLLAASFLRVKRRRVASALRIVTASIRHTCFVSLSQTCLWTASSSMVCDHTRMAPAQWLGLSSTLSVHQHFDWTWFPAAHWCSARIQSVSTFDHSEMTLIFWCTCSFDHSRMSCSDPYSRRQENLAVLRQTWSRPRLPSAWHNFLWL